MRKEYFKQFVIPFSGLKLGEHKFSFNITNAFFEVFSYEGVTGANISVDLRLEKSSTMMIFNFDLKGTIKTNCDLCTGVLELPVSSKEKLIGKFSNDETEDDDIVSISFSEYEFDVSNILFEYIVLSIPMKKNHENEKDCDDEYLDYVSGYDDEDLENNKEIDPRWEALMKLKSKN